MPRRPRVRPRPPAGAERTYAAVLDAWLRGFQAYCLEQIEAAWYHDNHGHAYKLPPHTDALSSSRVVNVVGGLRVALAERFAPGAQLSQDVRTVAARVNKQNGLEFQRVVGIPTTDLGLGPQVAKFRDQNISLIKSLAGDQLDDLETVLFEADRDALRVEDLRSQIQERFDVTKSKADFLARDQVLKLNGDLTQTRQTNAGIVSYIWRTSLDERVRETHADLENTEQLWASPPVVDEKTQRTAHPGKDFQCRCTAEPILPVLEEEEDAPEV